MRQEIVTFKFSPPLGPEMEAKLTAEFETLLVQIENAMTIAEHKTTNTLQHSVFRNIRENIRKYIILERVSMAEYRIGIMSDVLMAFDVKLPVDGVRTTGAMLATKIGKVFMQDIPHKTALTIAYKAKAKPKKRKPKVRKK